MYLTISARGFLIY